jgi:REP-associated tyrosine transposase
MISNQSCGITSPALRKTMWFLFWNAAAPPTTLHVLLVLPSDMPLSKAVQVLKANSSRWLSEHGIDFAWQEGYAAFSVSTSQLGTVREYIQNQAAHHRHRNFEEEFIGLLKKSGIAYDPKHVLG